MDQCWWIFEQTGRLPDIREVAQHDQDYINDMMMWGEIIAYVKTQAKQRTG